MKRGRACRYCGSCAWRNPCWWSLKHPETARCGDDPPCVCDDYYADQKRRGRRAFLDVFIPFALVVGAGIAAFLIF
jgi:hypothetical protein